MNVQDLDKVNSLWKAHTYWTKVQSEYQNNNLFLCVDFKNNGGTRYSLNDLLSYDTTKDGPTAALICQALTKRLGEIELALEALGVEIHRPMKPSAAR